MSEEKKHKHKYKKDFYHNLNRVWVYICACGAWKTKGTAGEKGKH